MVWLTKTPLHFLIICLHCLAILPRLIQGAGNQSETDEDPHPELAEDAGLTTTGLIFKYGYPVETHEIATQDGYLLEIHRIPRLGGQPVLVQHGLFDSSATFVIMGPEKGLAYTLADHGYDVWLGNSRGNRYSRKHVHKQPINESFWKFSWHEMGIYDLPSVIDHILSRSKFKKIHYVGHSQGTTAFFVMCSERPEYNSKIELMQALAPIAYLTNSKPPFRQFLSNALESLSFTASALGIYEMLPRNALFATAGQVACRERSETQRYCHNLLFAFGGYNDKQMNMTMLPVIYGHAPAGASIMQLIHFGQVMKSGHFRQFDYGAVRNLVRYRSLEPPDYNLTQVTAPIVLHYANSDDLSVAEDVELLGTQLKNLKGKRIVPLNSFNHIDFLWGIDAKELLYNNVIARMGRMGKEEEI